MSVGVVTAEGVDEPELERGIVLLFDHRDLDTLLVWLRDAANKAVQRSNMRPINFLFKTDHDVRPEIAGTWLNFWNWSVKIWHRDPEYVDVGDPMRDPKTGETLVNSQGQEVYDEVWEIRTSIAVAFYNKRDWPSDARRDDFNAHFAGHRLMLYFTHSERGIVTPSNIERLDEGGVTKEDARNALFPPDAGPDLVFEQELDDVAGFHPIGAPHFTATFDPQSGVVPARPAVVSEHLRIARVSALLSGLGEGAARIISEGLKTSAHYFTSDSVTAELGGEDEFNSFHLRMHGVFVTYTVLRTRALALYTQKLRRMTRRAEASPPQSPGQRRPEKQPREPLGTKFVGCDLCKRREAKFSCEGCEGAVYCGEECQALAWDFGHLQLCKSVH